jgi:hypothetical protein
MVFGAMSICEMSTFFFGAMSFGAMSTSRHSNAYSSDKNVLSGVPQGSILGPLLFIFFIHDIVDCCESADVKVKLYADDLKAYVVHKNQPSKIFSLQNFINNRTIMVLSSNPPNAIFSTLVVATISSPILFSVLLYRPKVL